VRADIRTIPRRTAYGRYVHFLLMFFMMGFLRIRENPSSNPPKKQNQLHKPRPSAKETPIQRTNIPAIEYRPSIFPGKMIVFVRAAGMMVIGITRWQKGAPPSIMVARLSAMLPLTAIRLEMKEKTKHTARVIKSIDLNRSVFPVRTMRKKRILKKRKVAIKANKRSPSVGIDPCVSIMNVKNIMGRHKRTVLNKLRFFIAKTAVVSFFISYSLLSTLLSLNTDNKPLLIRQPFYL